MAIRFTWFMALALALVATVTFASGESDAGSAASAEKEYVTDPSTGKQVVKPEYGGTITGALLTRPYDHGDTWITHGAGLISGPAMDKLGQANWAIDRSLSPFTTYYPENVVTGLLAESWENPDPLTYRYTIHDNVFFHDKPPVNGRQLTADDVAANYERLLGIGRFAGQEPAAHTWGTKRIPMESVTAIDDLTFEIKLSQPYADTARSLFDDCHIRAYPPEIFDSLHDANNVIGTGPFIMDEFVSATSITFDKNPNYWRDDEKFPGNRLPYVDRLVFLMMSDEATRVAALRSGQIDISGDLGTSAIRSISTVADLQERHPEMQYWPISFRSETSLAFKMVEAGPLSDVRVRRAMQMAIDIEAISDNYYRGLAKPQPWGPIGPAWIGYHNPFDTWPEELQQYWVYDPEGAERLLDEAGYPRGDDGVRFRTTVSVNGDRSDIGYHELQVGYWKEIGVEVELRAPDNATFIGQISSGEWDGLVWHVSVGADYGNLDGSLGGFRAGASFTGGAFNDPVFDARWNELQATTGDEYRQMAKALDLYVVEQHRYLWGPLVPSFTVSQPWLVGYNGEMQMGNCGWTEIYPRLWVDSQLKDEMN